MTKQLRLFVLPEDACNHICQLYPSGESRIHEVWRIHNVSEGLPFPMSVEISLKFMSKSPVLAAIAVNQNDGKRRFIKQQCMDPLENISVLAG